MAYENPRIYGTGDNSSIGEQLVKFYYQREALIDAKKEAFFGQLADTTNMPKHYGKTIKLNHYIPMLDDRNINDQGIDATGSAITDEVTIVVSDPAGMERFAVGTGSNAAAALTAAKAKVVSMLKNIGLTVTSYDAIKTSLTAAGWKFEEGGAVNSGGNLYGSSRDVGTIVGQLPTLSENGGRVNRVGFTRIPIEGTMTNFGFFDEYTEDSVQFDTDADLLQHISRETIRAANQIYEDTLQIDLLNGANVVLYGGNATSMSTITGETGATKKSALTYDLLQKANKILNDNDCPRDTTMITGSKMTDTRTIGSARYCYIGSELREDLLRMVNYHGKEAFIAVEKYGEAGKIAAGEIGAVDNFRFIENPQMMHWEGAGASVTDNAGYMETNGKYDVYPLLIVGSKTFTTIGFQTSGSNTKFKILHKAPNQNIDRADPYGKTGFYSIQWWYGTIILRPERIACIKVVARRS